MTRVCLGNQWWGRSGGKTFSQGVPMHKEANEKMVLKLLAYSSDTPLCEYIANHRKTRQLKAVFVDLMGAALICPAFGWTRGKS
jgi:hypothetical protein